jgi:hypothetical protein
MAVECIFSEDSATVGKGASECGDVFDVAPEFDLLGEEGVASLAVLGALVGGNALVLCGEFCCGDDYGVVGHSGL